MLWKETKCKIVPTLYYLLCKKKEGVRKYKCALRGGGSDFAKLIF